MPHIVACRQTTQAHTPKHTVAVPVQANLQSPFPSPSQSWSLSLPLSVCGKWRRRAAGARGHATKRTRQLVSWQVFAKIKRIASNNSNNNMAIRHQQRTAKCDSWLQVPTQAGKLRMHRRQLAYFIQLTPIRDQRFAISERETVIASCPAPASESVCAISQAWRVENIVGNISC